MLWLYAIADVEPVRLADGLRTFRCGELVAVVEELDRQRPVDPHSLRAHDRVVRRLADTLPALLPARFGQTASDEETLALRLADRQADLVAALDHVRGCVQVTVRIHGDAPDSASEETSERRSDDSVDLGAGRRYLRSRLAARQISGLDGLQRMVEPWAKEIRTRRGPKPVLASAYHLVAQDDVSSLTAAARAVELPGDLKLEVGEPSPAYAFASPAGLLGVAGP